MRKVSGFFNLISTFLEIQMVQHTRKTPDDLRSRSEWNKHDLTMNISKSVIIENHKFGIPICFFISIKLEFLACLSDLFVLLASLQSCFFFSAFLLLFFVSSL